MATTAFPKIKPVSVTTKNSADGLAADIVFVVVDETEIKDKKITSQSLSQIDKQLAGQVSALVEGGDFEGKWLQTTTTLLGQNTVARRVTLVGAGKKTDILPARARGVGLRLAEETAKAKAAHVAVMGSSQLLAKPELLKQVGLGFHKGTYKYPNTNLPDTAKNELETPVKLTLVGDASGVTAEIETLAKATAHARLLQDGPPNIVTPKFVADVMTERAKAAGLKTTVMGAQKLKEIGFNAMMAVGGGSANEPQFVIFEYAPANAKKTVAFVGKGLTMDTGGYSLKPPESQVGMKYDMSGSAIVLNSVIAIAELKLPIRVFGVAALCENMVDAHAYRVNDVITSYSGKTIEILNTDAEGRVVLSDALAYTAKDLKPDYIFEYSTLTGAVVIGLGQVGAGVFTFGDATLESTIKTASENTGERMWILPAWEETSEGVKGTITDLINVGKPPRSAGSIVGAVFLKEFTGDVPYAHIDIAGVANDCIAVGYPKTISSGYGVQLSVEIARTLAK